MSAVRWLIVPAAGKGARMGSPLPKQYLMLQSQTVLACTLGRLHQAWPDAHLILSLSEDDEHFQPEMVPTFAAWTRVHGGDERAHSVLNGLRAIQPQATPDDWVAVHDVARPCVTREDLQRLETAVAHDEVGGLLAAPVADTMKRALPGSLKVATTEPREGLWHALTPQLFRYGLLLEALQQAEQQAHARQQSLGQTITDEASAIEALGARPCLVAGRRDNIKITHPEDLPFAEQILAAQSGAFKG